MDQQVEVLDGFVRGLDFEDRQGLQRMRRYVDRQRTRFPEQFVGFASIPTFTPTTRTAFVVHALEELAGSSDEERQRLHEALAEAAPADGRVDPTWLCRVLSHWVAAGCACPLEASEARDAP